MSGLAKIVKEMSGHKITETEQQLLLELREKVRVGKISVSEAKEVWNKKVLVPQGEKPFLKDK